MVSPRSLASPRSRAKPTMGRGSPPPPWKLHVLNGGTARPRPEPLIHQAATASCRPPGACAARPLPARGVAGSGAWNGEKRRRIPSGNSASAPKMRRRFMDSRLHRTKQKASVPLRCIETPDYRSAAFRLRDSPACARTVPASPGRVVGQIPTFAPASSDDSRRSTEIICAGAVARASCPARPRPCLNEAIFSGAAARRRGHSGAARTVERISEL